MLAALVAAVAGSTNTDKRSAGAWDLVGLAGLSPGPSSIPAALVISSGGNGKCSRIILEFYIFNIYLWRPMYLHYLTRSAESQPDDNDSVKCRY